MLPPVTDSACTIRLREALSSWESTHSDQGTDEDNGEQEAEAERALRAAAWAILERIRLLHQELATLAPQATEAIDALAAVAEREALLAERSSRHGELAGVAFRERERTLRLETARDGIEGATANLEEAMAALDD